MSEDVLKEIIAIMSRHLRQNELREAMVSGLDGIRAALGSSEKAEARPNELSDEIIEEEGA
jgi:hypothetical protein